MVWPAPMRGFMALLLFLVTTQAFATTCEEALSRLEETMRFGPEVTFTSPALFKYSAHSKPMAGFGAHPFTKEDFEFVLSRTLLGLGLLQKDTYQDLVKFLTKVLPVEEGVLHIAGAHGRVLLDEVGIHRQYIALAVTLKNGKKAIVSLDDGCIEVNFPPQKIAEIEPLWKPIFKRAKREGFAGYFGFACGGGGGHMHVGFSCYEENLFVQNPELVAKLFGFYLYNPSVLLFLNNLFDHGPHGNSPTPIDHFENSAYGALEEIFAQMAATDAKPYLDAGQSWFRALILEPQKDYVLSSVLSVLIRHYSYLSAKHYDDLNVRFESRGQRAYNSELDVSASATLLLHAMAYFLSEKDLPQAQRLENQTMMSAHSVRDVFISSERQKFNELLHKLRVPERIRRRLLRFGGDDLTKGAPITYEQRLFPKAMPRLLWAPYRDDSGFSFELLLPVDNATASRIKYLKVNDAYARFSVLDWHSGKAVATLIRGWPLSGAENMRISYHDANDQVVDGVQLQLRWRAPVIKQGYPNVTAELVSLQKKLPAPARANSDAYRVLVPKTDHLSQRLRGADNARLLVNGAPIETFSLFEMPLSYLVEIPRSVFDERAERQPLAIISVHNRLDEAASGSTVFQLDNRTGPEARRVLARLMTQRKSFNRGDEDYYKINQQVVDALNEYLWTPTNGVETNSAMLRRLISHHYPNVFEELPLTPGQTQEPATHLPPHESEF